MSELFEVRLTRSAEKDLLDLRELTEKATKKILALKQAPYKGHPLKGRLKGVRALEFSLKGVAYRAAYVVLSEVGAGRKGERVCLVFTVGAHEGFYEKAERRAEALMK